MNKQEAKYLIYACASTMSVFTIFGMVHLYNLINYHKSSVFVTNFISIVLGSSIGIVILCSKWAFIKIILRLISYVTVLLLAYLFFVQIFDLHYFPFIVKKNVSYRWLEIGSLTLQVNEFSRLAVIFFASMFVYRNNYKQSILSNIIVGLRKFLEVKNYKKNNFLSILKSLRVNSYYIRPIFFALLTIILTLGKFNSISMAVFCSIIVAYILISYMKVSLYEILLGIVFLVSMISMGLFFFTSKLQRTITNYFSDAPNIDRAKQAITDGGFWGNNTTREYSSYIDLSDSDGVLSTFIAEMGGFGLFMLMTGMLFIFYSCYKISILAKNRLQGSILFGCAFSLIFPFIYQWAGSIGIFPPTGFLISFFGNGGTNKLVTTITCFLIIKISFLIIKEYPNESLRK